MLATFLVQYPWVAPVALLGFALVSPFIGWWLLPRRRVTGALLIAAVVAVLAFVFFPTGRTLTVSCQVEWVLPVPGAVEPFANVVLFVPAVFLAALLTRRPLTAAAFGVVGAALIEALQALLPTLGRSCSTGDWLANSIGALIAAGLAWIARANAARFAHARQRRGALT